MSILAALGFITQLGVAPMDGVLLMTYVRQTRVACVEPATLEEATLQAVLSRLHPVLETALRVGCGLRPTALLHAIDGEAQRPLAIDPVGGLISAAGLTMLPSPWLDKRFDDRWGRGRERRAR